MTRFLPTVPFDPLFGACSPKAPPSGPASAPEPQAEATGSPLARFAAAANDSAPPARVAVSATVKIDRPDRPEGLRSNPIGLSPGSGGETIHLAARSHSAPPDADSPPLRRMTVRFATRCPIFYLLR